MAIMWFRQKYQTYRELRSDSSTAVTPSEEFLTDGSDLFVLGIGVLDACLKRREVCARSTFFSNYQKWCQKKQNE